MEDCRVCKIIPSVLGKKFMMPLLGHKYPVIKFEEVRPHLANLDLKIVGGLIKRGWTSNDIDVVGKHSDVEVFSKRIRASGIINPIHFCGTDTHHSHTQCAYYGVKLAFTGRGY